MYVSFPLKMDDDGQIVDQNMKTVTTKKGILCPWIELIHGDAEIEKIRQAVALASELS